MTTKTSQSKNAIQCNNVIVTKEYLDARVTQPLVTLIKYNCSQHDLYVIGNNKLISDNQDNFMDDIMLW